MVAPRAGAGASRHPVVASRRSELRAVARALFLLLPALLVAACGGGAADSPATPVAPTDGALTVRAFEWGFEPQALVLSQGEQVRIVLENEGAILHDFKVEDGPAADVIESRSTGPLSGEEGELFVGAEAGQQGTLVFIPQASGTFIFYCTIQGHREFGMEGALTVE
ncbi:MAG: hypothetical protein A2148_05525 [Chloroflexi bacterium RBG_16_68_14]|nr:MAG: hypothetical protein A2148_05525 [Chloroflexi bacterium RBG_16_68_14]